MSGDLETAFKAAKANLEALTERPGNQELLQLYAHYKQATEGDCQGDRPGAFDFVKRAKFDAWANLQGMGQAQAMQAYIAIVEQLR